MGNAMAPLQPISFAMQHEISGCEASKQSFFNDVNLYALILLWQPFPVQKEEDCMTVESHLAELERRHLAIDTKISDEQRRPATDAIEIASLKKQKLSLKDEIERLRKGVDTARHN